MLLYHSMFSDKFFEAYQANIQTDFEAIENLDAKIQALKDWYEASQSGKVGQLTEKQQQGEFLDLLFETVLGYTKTADEWKLEKEYTFANGAEADGVLGFFGVNKKPNVRAVIELKGLKINLDKAQNQRSDRFTPVQQAFHYARQAPNCEWVLVSNFDEIRLYHASDTQRYESFLFVELMAEKPVQEKKQKITPKLLAQKYPNLPKFFYLLAYGNLYNRLDNSEESNLASTQKLYTHRAKRLADISLKFYKGYKKYRYELTKHLQAENKHLQLPDYEYFNLANKIFDRLIFLRFAEEVGILSRRIMGDYVNLMQSVPTDEPIYWYLIKAYFRSFDIGYKELVPPFNGELFKPLPILEKMEVQNEILNDILLFLRQYDFKNELKVDILGHIFEQSLNDQADSSPSKEGKTGLRNQDGIFYTPEYITDFIISETLTSYLNEHKELIYRDLSVDYLSELDYDHKRWAEQNPAWTRHQSIEIHAIFFERYKTVLQKIKILDPACGSGAFLTRVFDYLLKENELVMNELDKFANKIYEELLPEVPSSQASQKNKSKEKNSQDMFGAQEAQENKRLQKLAVLAKEILLNNLFGVDLNQESVEITKLALWLKTANKHKIPLANLSDNIKMGNSLVADEALDPKALDWEKAFPFGKFDLIVGNPPYVRMQIFQNNNPQVIPYFKEHYQTAHFGNYDLYVLFVEKSTYLLKEGGFCSFILPNKFFTTDYGQGLRSFLGERKNIWQIVNFKHHQVFENATIYTCMLFLSQKEQPTFRYIETKPKELDHAKFAFHALAISKLQENTWFFGNEKEELERETLQGTGVRLIDLPCQISRGSSTGNDKIFILKKIQNNIYENGLGERVKLEDEALKKAIFATDFSRYFFRNEWEYYVIFPYEIKEQKTEILSEEKFATLYPLAYQYLNDKKTALSLRKHEGKWYEYSAARSLKNHISSDILIPLLANRGLFALMPNNKQDYTLMAGGGFSLKIDNEAINKKYLLGLLNSKLLFGFLEKISNTFRGGWVTCTKQYFAEIPIKIPDFSNTKEKQIHDQIVQLVDSLTLMYENKEQHIAQIEQIETQLDEAVLELYGVTKDFKDK